MPLCAATPGRSIRQYERVSEPVTEYVSLTYGSVVDIRQTRAEVETKIAVTFALHDSDYRGGDYYVGLAGPSGEEWIIQPNTDGDERAVSTWLGPTVLYVEATRRDGEIIETLAGSSVLTLLESRAWSRG